MGRSRWCMRDTARGKSDLYANGARDLLVCFRDLKYEPAKDGRFHAAGFDNFVGAVEFATPIRAKVLLTSGNSSHPNSPHYGDQLVLSSKQLRDAWLTRVAVEMHVESRVMFARGGRVKFECIGCMGEPPWCF
jgi:acyl-homoserine-lactone acylase